MKMDELRVGSGRKKKDEMIFEKLTFDVTKKHEAADDEKKADSEPEMESGTGTEHYFLCNVTNRLFKHIWH